MKNRGRDIAVTIVFVFFLFAFFGINLLKSPEEISVSERRKLAMMPEFSGENVKSTKFMTDFEKYALDQFPFREDFRRLKAKVLFDVFQQKDNHEIYIAENQASAYKDKFNEVSVQDAAKKFNKLQKQFLLNMNVYYSVIPDKNYFLAEKNGYPHYNYAEFEKLLTSNVNENLTYISLFDCLRPEDYYSTDTHWRQEKLKNVVNRLGENMRFHKRFEEQNYERSETHDFYGVFYGQSALPMEADVLVYLTNDAIKTAKVSILDEETFEMKPAEVYAKEKLEGQDSYDVFLSGATALITIENEQAETEKELYIFRDSYGSSLTPLLISEYKKITMIDLRYIATPALKQLVEWKDGQDALIILCTDVINSSSILKVF
ncbi:MAG: hypothetical protein J6M02_02820 [Clostridia bacterium]|nr:hypothetical protein [Clostridia bacterium]